LKEETMELAPWSLSGSYYEVCNCEAICPCRRQGGRKGGAPSYETCDFALSWWIEDGRAGSLDLTGLKVVMAGRYVRDDPDNWQVSLYLDEQASAQQCSALIALFLGRVGETKIATFPFAAWITGVHATRSARIELDHSPNGQRIEVAPYLTVRTREPVQQQESVSCGIPGHQFAGQEIRAEVVRYQDGPYDWEFRGRCGFASRFSYASG
jgi:hypothetical protein